MSQMEPDAGDVVVLGPIAPPIVRDGNRYALTVDSEGAVFLQWHPRVLGLLSNPECL
jgi:hypothetical protein